MKVTFQLKGKVTTGNVYSIEPCPDSVAKEVKSLVGNDVNANVTMKEAVKIERGLIHALSKLLDNHPADKDEIVNVSIKVED